MLDLMAQVAQASKECRVLRIAYPDLGRVAGFLDRLLNPEVADGILASVI